MSNLTGWWAGLSAAEHFEVFKIVLDKGLFAFLIALAGYWFARRQETFKAFEVRRLELEKITIPRVHALMKETDAFWREGRDVTGRMDKAFTEQWSPWIDQIIANVSKPVDGVSLSRTGAEILECRLQNGRTIREHFIELASDTDMKERLAAAVPTGEWHFLTNLFNFYYSPSNVLYSDPRNLLEGSFLMDFFKDVTRAERDAFLQRVEDFVMEAKNVMPPHKERPFEGVVTGADILKSAVVDFPDARGTQLLRDAFLAISSQLREAIRP